MSVHAPSFTTASRVLLIAPHPDDESLACSIAIQRAVSAGASIRVVYATDGDNNPWPQRLLDRKWRLTEFDRARWGQLRRQEALDALAISGVDNSDVEFLGLPDQGLTDLLVSGCERTLHRLAQCITDWAPTDVLGPDITDTHPDHSALGVMLRVVLERLPPPFRRRSIWTFLVHGDNRDFIGRSVMLRQTPKETAIKIMAISRHQTQLKLSNRRFMGYAARPERFASIEFSAPCAASLARRSKHSGEVVVALPRSQARPLRGSPQLLLLGHNAAGALRCVRAILRSGVTKTAAVDCASGADIGQIRLEQNGAGQIEAAINGDLFAPDHPLYLKIQRRRIFFDQTGWTRATSGEVVTEVAEKDLVEQLSLAAS